MWSSNCLPALFFTIPNCLAELVFQAPPNAFRLCPADLQMSSPTCHVLRLSCRCGAPIASELPYACRPQLPTVFQAWPTVISRLRLICCLVAFEIWSSNASLLVSLAFTCLPVCLVLPGSPDVSLYLSPFMCLVVCLYKCPALNLPPLLPTAESRWVSIFRSWGGITASPSLRICTQGSGKLGALSPPVSPSVSPRFVFHLVSRFVDCPVLHCVSHFVPDIVPHFVSQHVSDCASNFAPPLRFPMCLALRFASSLSRKFVSIKFSTLSSAFFHFRSNL